MKNQIKNILQSGFFTILIMVSGFFMSHVALALKGSFDSEKTALNINQSSEGQVLGDTNDDSIILGFAGDIAPAHSENEFHIENFFSPIQEYLEYPDIMIGNLEGTFSMMGTPKCNEEEKGCYLFSGTEAFLKEIKKGGFDVLSLANNHAYDYGKEGFDETKRLLAINNIIAMGDREDIRYIETPQGTIALIGASSYYWSPSLIDTNDLIDHIHEATKKASIVVIFFHGGAEGKEYLHTPSTTEWYMGENRGDLRMMARRAIDEGADIIVGSGPHVLRGMEIYKQRLIAYSLGNFTFSGTDTLSQKDSLGISALLYAKLDSEGEFLDGTLIPLTISQGGVPMVDEQKTALEYVRTLSKEDFMYSGIDIDSNGQLKVPAN